MFEKLDKILDSFIAMGIPSYDCVVMQDGKEVYRRMDGYSDYERTVRIKDNERYNIYIPALNLSPVRRLFSF